MIRNEAEYKEALRRLDQDREIARQQRAALETASLSLEDVDLAMEPLLSFQAQLAEEVQWYDDVKAGKFPVIRRLTQLGRILIALRIAKSLTQRELAERLGVSEAQVSRDEKNEYHGITIERAQKIVDVLNAAIVSTVTVEDAPPAEEPMYASAL